MYPRIPRNSGTFHAFNIQINYLYRFFQINCEPTPCKQASDIAPQYLALCKRKMDKVCLYEKQFSNIRTFMVRCTTEDITMTNGLTCAQGTFIALIPKILTYEQLTDVL